jgi:pilus assembly protein Flp/PilA
VDFFNGQDDENSLQIKELALSSSRSILPESLMDRVGRLLSALLVDETGQDLIEYALLSAFVALVCVAGATTLGTALNNWYSSVGSAVNGHAATAS